MMASLKFTGFQGVGSLEGIQIWLDETYEQAEAAILTPNPSFTTNPEVGMKSNI